MAGLINSSHMCVFKVNAQEFGSIIRRQGLIVMFQAFLFSSGGRIQVAPRYNSIKALANLPCAMPSFSTLMTKFMLEAWFIKWACPEKNFARCARIHI